MHQCDYQNFFTQNYIIWSYFLLCIFFLAFLITGILWIRRIHYFPIRERSPYLLFLTLIMGFFNIILIPLMAILIYYGVFLLDLTKFISFFTFYGMFTNYFWRGLRLYYVLATRIENKFFDYLMKKESILIVISLLISSIFGILGTQYSSDFIFESVICNLDTYKVSQAWIISMETFIFLYELSSLILIFKLKSVRTSYNISKELYFVTLIFISTNICLRLLYQFLAENKEKFFYISNFIIIIRNLSIWGISFVYTLFISHHGRSPTPTTFIFEELKYFMLDSLCLETFHCYLKMSGNNILGLFHFYLDIESKRINPKQLFEQYFENNIFPLQMKERINEIKNNNENFCYTNMNEMKNFAYDRLENLFVEFKRTKACNCLKRLYEKHEEITARLFTFNMESFNSQF